ncbi:hypothetical protein CHUAL_012059 [Chamberlinius hualienensis]
MKTMKLQPRNQLISICLLAVVYSGAVSGTPKDGDICCHFDETNCLESTSTDWRWTTTPPLPIPPLPSGSCIWTPSSGSIAEFPLITIVELNNDFLFSYYIENIYDHLIVTFIPTVGTPFELGPLRNSTYIWQSDHASCSNIQCCDGASTCDGNLVVTSQVGVGGGGLYAIDSVDFNDGCF